VLAAASLTEAFGEIGRRFEAAHPGVTVRFGFDASSTIVRQVAAGAPADVVATADEVTMQRAVDAGAVGPPALFARNHLAVVVAPGNPEGIGSLADLARPGLTVVLCAPEAPCGRAAATALERAGVRLAPRSLEPTVKGVVARVRLGEADAGIVFATEVRAAAPHVEGLPLPPAHDVEVAYPIAPVRSSSRPAEAAGFVAFVRSGEGRAVLAAAGFSV
jgi:molybdate transport system substrate-binding protein